jgi:hypothetical protein
MMTKSDAVLFSLTASRVTRQSRAGGGEAWRGVQSNSLTASSSVYGCNAAANIHPTSLLLVVILHSSCLAVGVLSL